MNCILHLTFVKPEAGDIGVGGQRGLGRVLPGVGLHGRVDGLDSLQQLQVETYVRGNVKITTHSTALQLDLTHEYQHKLRSLSLELQTKVIRRYEDFTNTEKAPALLLESALKRFHI